MVANSTALTPRLAAPASAGHEPHGGRPATEHDKGRGAAAGSVQSPADRVVLTSVYLQDPTVDHDGPATVPVAQHLVEPHGRKLCGPHFETSNARNPRTLAADPEGNLLLSQSAPDLDMVNAQVHAEGTVSMYESMLGHPIAFKFDDGAHPVHIYVNRRDPDGSHADLSKGTLTLDWGRSVEMGREVRDSESSEIIAHEVGHLVLGSVRPHLSDTDAETAAFHESFGDISAMLYSLTFDQNIKSYAEETRHDPGRRNLISEFDEDGGKMTQLRHYPDAHRPHNVRSAVNDFKYADPSTLHDSDACYSNRVLSPEAHDFSQIFTGAFYDVFSAMVEREAPAKGREVAAVAARDRLMQIWGGALDKLPKTRVHFADAARAMLESDRELGGGELGLMREVFAKRNINCT
jgi:hypothetical protein